jgi:hypothetical protein
LVDKVVALTLEPPAQKQRSLDGSYHGQDGIAAASALKIWHNHGLAPHRWHSTALSNDMAFAEKLHDVVGLYAPNAIVLSVDQRSWIQTVYHSPPELPLKQGCGITMHARLQAQWHNNALYRP